jgi:hypothetical protein
MLSSMRTSVNFVMNYASIQIVGGGEDGMQIGRLTTDRLLHD